MSSNTTGILNSTLHVNKRLMDIAMQNIANADNPIYSAKEADISSIVSGNSLGGVKIDMIRNKTDLLMQKNLLNANSIASSSKYVSDISKEVMNKLALPGENAGVYKRLSEFEDAILQTSLNPTDISLRNDLRDKANDVTSYISSTATFVQQKRFEADDMLHSSLKDVNIILSSLNELNAKRMLYKDGTIEHCQLSDQVDFEMGKLSKYFGIRSNLDSTGVLHVFLKNNGQEILGKQVYSFEYISQDSVENFIDDQPLNPLYLVAKSFNGAQENRAVIIDGYKSSDLSYNFGEGLIDGLLEVRDSLMPKVAQTLDQLALNVAEVFNQTHNNGNGLMPITSLTGTTEISASDALIGSGSFIINPMDSSGKPIVTGNSGKIPAMNLDLSQFTNNGLAGTFNVAGIVNEINNYFSAAATGTRLAINGFHTINMAVTNADSSTGNNMNLDFDLISYSTQPEISNMQFSIANVSAVDSNGANVSAQVINNTSGFNIENGAHQRTGVNGGPSITLGNTGNYPITISLDIVTTVNNINTTATVEYTINAPTTDELNSINGIVNKRFTPTTLESSDDPNTQLLTSGYSKPIVKASIVDEFGREVTGNDPKGFLKIENLIRGCGIAINECDSQVLSSTNAGINGGFSAAFSMNNMFVFQSGQTVISDPKNRKNIATFMQLNNAIKASPNAFAIGKMQEYRAGENSFDAPGIFYAAGAGDTSLVKGYQNIRNQNVIFRQTQDIGIKQTNIYEYAADIVNVNNIRTINLNIDSVRNEQLREMIHNDISSGRGVNIDDEAIKVMQYQKNYTIAAKFINTTNNLLQTLIDNLN
jgi:flagellar hook-associated protein FlgK